MSGSKRQDEGRKYGKGPPQQYRLNPRIASVVAPLERLLFALFDSKIADKWSSLVENERILVLRTDHIGDMVLSSSFFRNLRRSFPNAEITVLCRKMNEQLAQLMEGVDRVEVMNTPWLARDDRDSLGAMLRRLKTYRHHFDLALDLHPHPFNIVLGKILAKRMVGFNFRGLGFLLNLSLSDSPVGTHVVDRNLRLVEAIGGKVDNSKLSLQVPAECSQRVRSLLTGLGVKPGNFMVVIHPGVGVASKKWPVDSFSALVDLITPYPSAEVVLVDKDETRVLPIIDGLMNKRVHNLAGKIDLVGLIALIKESRLVIGLESMVVHLAASVGTPVVELHSGQSSASEWGVYQGDCEIITKNVDCSPCGRTRCEDNLCMRLITPMEVFSATKRLAAKVYGHESPFC
jgi:ADP-heptose:LPS heptosyltransferase